MIQCVGSRNEERPYCSRICCSNAIKHALELKEADPDLDVVILFRDVMTYGFLEKYYLQGAEGRGAVRALREGAAARCRGSERQADPYLLRPLDHGRADLRYRSSGAERRDNSRAERGAWEPPQGAEDPGGLLPGGAHEAAARRFCVRRHVPVRPCPFTEEHAGDHHPGGGCRGQGLHAYCRRTGYSSAASLRRCRPTSAPPASRCVRACPYSVPVINAKGEAEIDISKCKGCGTCAAECPAKAIDLMHYTDIQIIEKSGAMLWRKEGAMQFEPEIVAFCCEY